MWPPSYGARVLTCDVAAIEKLTGVVKVIRDGNFLAAVANKEFQLVKAMMALTAATTWRETASLPDQNDLAAALTQLGSQDSTIFDRGTPGEAPVTLKASYTRPYQFGAAGGRRSGRIPHQASQGSARSRRRQQGGEAFGWQPGRKPSKDRGYGFAFARYKNLAVYCAIATEVEIDRETGRPRLIRAVAAVDAGQVVNPDGITNQIEAAIMQSMSWKLYESVTFDDTRITSVDWQTYPILRFNAVPDQIEVHILNRPGMPFLGSGETGRDRRRHRSPTRSRT